MQRKDKTHKNSNSLSLYVLNKQASWTFTGIWECRLYSHPPKVFVKYENGRQILTKTISNFTSKSMIRLLKKEIPVFLNNSHYLRHIIVVCKFWETPHVNKDMSKGELVYRRSESMHFCALGCKCKIKIDISDCLAWSKVPCTDFFSGIVSEADKRIYQDPYDQRNFRVREVRKFSRTARRQCMKTLNE